MMNFKFLSFFLATSVLAHEQVPEVKPSLAEPVLKEFSASKLLSSPPFVEFFDQPDWIEKWIASETKKIIDGVEDETLLSYRGVWNVEEPTQWPGLKNDKALVAKTAAAHHAISVKFDEPVDPKGKDLVVQYEVKFQNNHDCGGAYMKFLTYDEKFSPISFSDKTPYTIMFGPDKCGFTNKVHFIFRHKNPITGEYEEKHLNSPPAGKFEKKTGLYTLIVRPDNTFEILVNNEKVSSGSLLADFTPAVNPPKEIDDPSDSKPSDWVDEAKIVDPEAKKPEDWDEDAPMEIPDEDAVKPQDWLDDEPLTVADPDAEKPEDWDDEEDGEWVAPTVANPKCKDVSGCGEWVRPNKPNPAYKGKWKAPLIDNPAYKGEWAPRKIENPNFFEDLHPANFEKIGALGFEIWTMNDGITFDNIYIGHSVDDAKKLAEEQWKVKFDAESAYESKPQEKSEKENEEDTIVDKLKNLGNQLLEEFAYFVQVFKQDPSNAVKQFPLVISGIVSTVVLLFTLVFAFGGKSTEKVVKEKKEVEEEEEKEKIDEKIDEDSADQKKSSPKKRKSTKKVDE